MRPACALAVCALAAAPAAAQPAAYLAEVTADAVAVRCGPSDQFPEAGMLFRGGHLVVAHDEGDQWVAVQPPRGQVSWIRSVHLGPIADGQEAEPIPRNAVVHAEPDAEVAYGRPGLGKPLDVRKTRVPDRTIVLVIGQKVKHGDAWWYPIEPPDGDFRYVPRSAVRLLRAQPGPGVVVRTPAEPPAKSGFEPAAASVPNKSGAGGSAHPLWEQAERADRNGDYDQAERLYLKLAAEMNQPGGDASLANLCYTRVHAVREKQRGAPRGGTTTEAARRPEAGEKWVGPGSLRPAGFKIDGRATYALVGPGGQVKCYAVSGSGVELERFRGLDVELFGALTYPGDLRGAGVMTATRVQRSLEK